MSTQATSPDAPFWLRDNFAPIFDEFTETKLEVTGSIPTSLNGRFFRNGSNPQSGTSFHWFLGNGMIHGVELQGGKANWYRNRYVQTPLYTDPDGGADPTSADRDRKRSLANTHIIAHAGRILALEEGSFPWEVTPELETVGAHDFDGKLKTAMTAHPRLCPETGELLFFGYSSKPPYLTYHRVAADGRLVQTEEITVSKPSMMHDWNVTRNHVIFMDLPMTFDLEAGGFGLKWDDDYGARLGVMPRDGKDADVVWYEIDPCYVFHPMNAYEEGDEIVIDTSRFEKFSMDGGESTPATLHRWRINTSSGKVAEQPIDDRPADFPRVHDRCVGLKHRFGYMTSTGSGGDMSTFGRELYKYDLETGKSWTHDFGPGCQAGEPVFAEGDGRGEEEGYVLTYVYDAARNKSDLVILDAVDFDKAPVARIHLPTRVPMGFHGSWIAD